MRDLVSVKVLKGLDKVDEVMVCNLSDEYLYFVFSSVVFESLELVMQNMVTNEYGVSLIPDGMIADVAEEMGVPYVKFMLKNLFDRQHEKVQKWKACLYYSGTDELLCERDIVLNKTESPYLKKYGSLI